ncbi:MAG: 5-formyltetrahydrofolate cyclo-ligase [Treponema sp.]|jgi:5-formyltetrahydrofolate cyclo-ligase|nr:5-formyltetrahydrofolate cyclo-ligase [Treponema sp.]
MQGESKAELRDLMKRRLKEAPSSLWHDEGAAAARLLEKIFRRSRGQSVLVFLSTPLEIDAAPLLETVLSLGEKAFAPTISGENLVFRRVHSAAGPWKTGPLGIREPALQSEVLGPHDFPVLALVPGMAFDLSGGRLGYGKACYDRFFTRLGGPCFKIGLCMNAQILPRIPADPWDVPMDALCTGSRFIPVAEVPPEWLK